MLGIPFSSLASRPSYYQGFARSAGESAFPQRWKGLRAALVPALGPTGMTLHDVSGHHSTGTLTNMDPATDWVIGGSRLAPGYALDFDGSNDQVDILKNASTDVGNVFTIMATILARDVMTADRQGVYSTRRTSDAGSWQLEVGSINGQDRAFGMTGPGTFIVVSPANSLVVGQWHRVVVMKFGSGATDTRIFLDGIELTPSSQSALNTIDSVDQPLIGEGTNGGQLFNGLISNVLLYDRILRTREVVVDYEKPMAMWQRRVDMIWKVPAGAGGRIMSSLVSHGGLVGQGGIAGFGGGLAG